MSGGVQSSKRIEPFAPELEKIISPSEPIQELADGFGGPLGPAEGPVWWKEGHYLLFSDMPGDHLRRWSEKDGVTTFRKPCNKSNGLAWDRHGRLIVCEHATSTLTRTETNGQSTVLASHYDGKELNSPNDVVIRSDGSIYFTDPTYGRKPVFGLERPQELDFQAVYRISPDGALHREAHDFVQPNGLCFSPDERILYVNDSERAHIRAFDVAADGSLSGSRIFADRIGTADYDEGVVDGMKCDELGNIYVTGPRGIWVLSPQGRHLGIIRMPEVAGNLNWGGPEWNDLYCACSTSIYRVKTRVHGNPVAYMRMA